MEARALKRKCTNRDVEERAVPRDGRSSFDGTQPHQTKTQAVSSLENENVREGSDGVSGWQTFKPPHFFYAWLEPVSMLQLLNVAIFFPAAI